MDPVSVTIHLEQKLDAIFKLLINDFQNGGRPPCWILKICIFRPVALVDLPFCFLIQNLDEIGVEWIMGRYFTPDTVLRDKRQK